MEWIGSLLMVLAVVFLVGIYVSQPFFRREAGPLKSKRLQANDEMERQRSALLAERDRILTSLQDLEFDHTLGKVPEEDYPAQRLVFMEEGAEVLRQLDALEPPKVQTKLSAEDRLEAAVAARRADARTNGNGGGTVVVAAAGGVPTRRRAMSNGHDDVEKLVDARRLSRSEKAAGFCPRCGKPVQKSDKFCSRCGASI